MATQRFRVYHTLHGEDIAVIEMDEALLAPEAKILDPDTMTLRHIKNGGTYTLVPIDDFRVSVLRRVKDVYETVTTKPAKLFSTSIGRMDELIQAVGLLFGDISFTVVKDKSDLEKLINQTMRGEWEPTKVTYKVLDSLLGDVAAAEVNAPADDEP